MSDKPAYERESRALIDNDVQSAISYSKSRCIAGKVAEWRDSQTVGLTLRITPGKAVWYIRRREITLRLGLASDGWGASIARGGIDLDTARYVAEQTRLAAKRKRNLREFVDTLVRLETTSQYRNPMGHAEIADEFADETSLFAYRKRIGDTGITWTWRALTHRFLEYQLPKLKAGYRKQYEHYLALKEFGSINDQLVGELKLRHLERVRDEIHLNHAPSAVHRALSQSKKMLSWAWKYHATASGLEKTEAEWWNRWSYEYKTGQRTHMPSVHEIARTLVIAETFRHLADGEHDTYPGTIGALWGVALTGQRTGACVRLCLDRLFEPTRFERKLRNWQIASWTAEEMKGGRDGGRPHSLPIPPEALKIMKQFHRQAGGDSPWMFPARHPEKHVSKSALNQLIYRLQGRVYDHTVKHKPDRKGKPGPKPRPKKLRPNLFEQFGIRPWTPHDCRRTITTFLEDQKLGGAATAILGHKMPNSQVDERERLARVTEQHYNRSQRIDLKAEGMALWVKSLLTAYEKERRMFQTYRRRAAA
jgi:integrase